MRCLDRLVRRAFLQRHSLSYLCQVSCCNSRRSTGIQRGEHGQLIPATTLSSRLVGHRRRVSERASERTRARISVRAYRCAQRRKNSWWCNREIPTRGRTWKSREWGRGDPIATKCRTALFFNLCSLLFHEERKIIAKCRRNVSRYERNIYILRHTRIARFGSFVCNGKILQCLEMLRIFFASRFIYIEIHMHDSVYTYQPCVKFRIASYIIYKSASQNFFHLYLIYFTSNNFSRFVFDNINSVL